MTGKKEGKGIPKVLGTTAVPYPFRLYGPEWHDAQSAARLVRRTGRTTSAKGYLRVGREFLQAFDLVGRDGPRLPRLYLAAQTVETLLKAYIALNDAPELQRLIRRKHGHDLRALWSTAVRLGESEKMQLSSIVQAELPFWMRALADHHAAPFLDRYPLDVNMMCSMANHDVLTGELRAPRRLSRSYSASTRWPSIAARDGDADDSQRSSANG